MSPFKTKYLLNKCNDIFNLMSMLKFSVDESVAIFNNFVSMDFIDTFTYVKYIIQQLVYSGCI